MKNGYKSELPSQLFRVLNIDHAAIVGYLFLSQSIQIFHYLPNLDQGWAKFKY